MISLVDPKLEKYCIENSSIPSKHCESILQYTLENVPMAVMVSGPVECGLIGFLLRTIQAKRVLEIGTFTGYSALAMAEQLPSDGEVTTIDQNPETTQTAKSFWAQSPHGTKIKPILGKAEDCLTKIQGPFDAVFIDADKQNYLHYVRTALEHLTPRGIIIVDNALWSGQVLDKNTSDPSTQGIQKMTRWVVAQPNLYCTLLPIRDGVLLVQKKS